jgi:hypothetical protein
MKLLAWRLLEEALGSSKVNSLFAINNTMIRLVFFSLGPGYLEGLLFAVRWSEQKSALTDMRPGDTAVEF